MEPDPAYDEDDPDAPSAVQQMDETLAEMRALRESLIKQVNLVDERDNAAELEHSRLQSSLIASVQTLVGQVASGESHSALQSTAASVNGDIRLKDAAAGTSSAADFVTGPAGGSFVNSLHDVPMAADACPTKSVGETSASFEGGRSRAATASSARRGSGVKAASNNGVVSNAVSSVSKLASRPLLPPEESLVQLQRSGRGRARGGAPGGSSNRGRGR
uniref:Uncharacterized protein n=1 Tax=Strombidinopsis acuminata TaxID=141414 RepID=A0A7S3TAN7_9SPIT|mmetsp:Transcript_28515/g.87258  ORF Transcript_28515/g.87258 Transcript_28515/m.87258 type:complete len:218 (+) Transcript_28515:83-736(+)|eukprot:scaffold61792_cov32-Tisochrysis_lutea.AAC.1